MVAENLEVYLSAGEFMDSDHPAVQAYAEKIAGNVSGEINIATTLYKHIRDGFLYDPFRLDLRPPALKASHLLTRNYGYCTEKANLLGACAKVFNIPARLGFGNVRNHIGTDRLEKKLGTSLLVFHGYTELYLAGKWVKATPAFNRHLCQKLGVEPLEFNGREDSIFQAYSPNGKQFMEYVTDHGYFADVPYDLFIAELRKHYPHIFDGLAEDELCFNI